MSKFLNWLFDGNTNEEVSVYSTPEPLLKPNRESERKQRREKFEEAYSRFTQEAQEQLESYKPKEPAFRIVQQPAGHYTIERRQVRSSSHYYKFAGYGLGLGEYYPEAERVDAYPRAPFEFFETVQNTDAPIKTMVNSYGRGLSSERLTGYADLAFNIFADAEAYLFRMIDPSAVTTEYDFPPLKKRAAKKSVKKEAAS